MGNITNRTDMSKAVRLWEADCDVKAAKIWNQRSLYNNKMILKKSHGSPSLLHKNVKVH